MMSMERDCGGELMADGALERGAEVKPEERPRWKKLLTAVAFVVIGVPLAALAGSIAGYVAGLIAAFLWSTPRQPPEEFEYLSGWGAVVGAVAGALLLLSIPAISHLEKRREKRLEGARRRHNLEYTLAGYDWTEIPPYTDPWQERFEKANTGAAIVAVVACIFVWDIYQHFIGHRMLAFLAALLLLPFLAYTGFQSTKGENTKTWAVAGAVVLLVFSARAVSGAFDHEYSNCWNVSNSGESDVVECAPGSEPIQGPPGYDRWSDSETPGRDCELVDEFAGGVTRWRCREI
jgi:hypothetical protein